jgi:hypothetical protein
LVKFQELGENWDGEGALPPPPDLLASAVGLAYLLKQRGVEPPGCVAPAPDGAVVLVWPAEVREVREVVDPLDQTTDLLNVIH